MTSRTLFKLGFIALWVLVLVVIASAFSCAPKAAPKVSTRAAAIAPRAAVSPNDFHVSVTGTVTDGNCHSPTGPYCSYKNWTRQDRYIPGTTIWMHGGRYVIHAGENETWYVHGTLGGGSVTVRSYPGEWAILSSDVVGGTSLMVGGDLTYGDPANWGGYITFQDLEITHELNAQRITAQNGSSPTDILMGDCINIRQNLTDIPGIKFINVVAHDCRQGVSLWQQAKGAYIYGLIDYYNGWYSTYGTGDDHGHGIYAQSYATGDLRSLIDMIIFSNSDRGIQAYGSSLVYPVDYTIKGGIWWNQTEAITIGGTNVGKRDTIDSNLLWGNGIGFGWSSWPVGSLTDSFITNNISAARIWLTNVLAPGGITMTGNNVPSDDQPQYQGYKRTDFPNNVWGQASNPTAPPVVFGRPNLYEPGRANIGIINWRKDATVPVRLSDYGIQVGASYHVQFAMDFFGAPVKTGYYTGGLVDFPMTGLVAAPPKGNLPIRANPAPEFAAFVVFTDSVSVPTASPTSSPTVTATVTSSATPTSSPTFTATTTATFTATRTKTFTPTKTATKTNTPTKTRTPTPATVCWTVTPASVCVTVTP